MSPDLDLVFRKEQRKLKEFNSVIFMVLVSVGKVHFSQ